MMPLVLYHDPHMYYVTSHISHGKIPLTFDVPATLLVINSSGMFLNCSLILLCTSYVKRYTKSLTNSKQKNVLNYHIHVRHTTRTTTTVLRPLYRSTCVSQHLQLRTAGFSWCKVLLPANQRIRIREKTLEFSSTVLSTRCLYLNMSDIMHITYKLFRFRLI